MHHTQSTSIILYFLLILIYVRGGKLFECYMLKITFSVFEGVMIFFYILYTGSVQLVARNKLLY